MVKIFYFDTYALIEITKSNTNYEPYKEDIKIILNKLNILEFVYFLMREGRNSEIKLFYDKFARYNIDYEDDDLIKAAEMKFKYVKQKLSFVDCIGYVLAQKNNAKFLTGDEKFQNKDNVEYVK